MDDAEGMLGDIFMTEIEPVAAHKPYMVCPGNHETKYNFSHYTNRFSGITGEGSGSGNNWYYSFDLSYAHFVGFSTEVYYNAYLNETMAAQYEWLQQDLMKAVANRHNVPWIIVFGHRPVYCSNVDDMPDCSSDAETLRKGVNGQYGIEQLLYDYSVDMYLCGHEHSYERTFPVYKGAYQQQDNHTYVNPIYPIHMVAGSAGCPEHLDYYDEVLYGPWSAMRSASYGYAHLSILNSTHLHWRQLTNDLIKQQPEPLDELWIIQEDRQETKMLREKHQREAHQKSTTGSCNAYCFVVCEREKKNQDCSDLCGGRDCDKISRLPEDHGIRVAVDKVHSRSHH